MTPEQRASLKLFGDTNFSPIHDGPFQLNCDPVFYSELVALYRLEEERASPARRALDLALVYLGRLEPGDSRAVSNEFVAMADYIKDGHLAIVHCHPEGLGAVDASQDQRDAIEKALRTAANQSGSALLDRVVKFEECTTAEPTLRWMIRDYYDARLPMNPGLTADYATRFITALATPPAQPATEVLARPPSDDLLAFAIVETFGEQCPTFDPDCYTCQAWAQYDAILALPCADEAEIRADEREKLKQIVADPNINDSIAAIIAAIDGAGKSSDVSGYFHPGITLVETKGMRKLEQRAYILHSLALGGLTAWKNKDRRCRAQNLWRKFQQRYPQFASAIRNGGKS